MQGSIIDWLRGSGTDGRNGGLLKYLIGGAYNGLFFSVTSRYPLGTNVFEREWDLLIVLDACRVDALRTVAPEFPFIDGVDSMWSLGSSSHEWLCNTFTNSFKEAIEGTMYISTNPHTPKTFFDGERPPTTYSVPFMWADWDVVDADNFGLLRQLHNHDNEAFSDTVLPDLVTDHAIHAGRTEDFDQLIVHYFQPHRPYIGTAYPENRPLNEVEDRPWEQIKRGVATKEEVWELYLENLRLVLRSVERLLENIDAETVAITADHGELFGELGLYGHPEGLIHPSLKKVPWALSTATDHRTSTPEVEVEGQDAEIDVTDRLENLGYI